MAKTKLVVLTDIPRYAKKGDKAIVNREFDDRSGIHMREVKFKDGSLLLFGEKAFTLLLQVKK